MIELRSITKAFDAHTAVSDISISVPTGSIYGLVGTNGSGKTTLLKMLAGVLTQDSGTIAYDGHPVYENAEVKRQIAFIPDDLTYFNRFTLHSAGTLTAGIYAQSWSQELFETAMHQFHLDPHMQFSKMSKGMRKQGVFCLVFARQPRYMLLDEPIDGLDPIVRKSIWELIVDATADRSMTAVISSHNLRELEGYCDHVCAIKAGKVAIEQDIEDLKSDIHKLQISFGPQRQPSAAMLEPLHILHEYDRGSINYLIVRNSDEELDRFVNRTHPVIFDEIPLTLEEIFMYELREDSNDYTSKH
ncbi:ABC transporter ATP-binding protein [Bifidobacterium aquikefiri]|uniref:ABC transporter n=1 Tax=Bifidobacterium aquikefiri TaxID=1653207 RepID=A0A261G6T9_9BIFI|nr:ABC transporter ATP-binding protein [Bifidobacterium aquikefiri]OZG67157.1 ABC transporter [Bifidobacterium aquikefiri]